MNIKIIVATHKKYWMPQDHMYLPLHVGHAIARESFGFQGDDTGEHISEKNANYCELTGVYWAWKNLDADYIGLVHYRRYISDKRCSLAARWQRDKTKIILKTETAEEILKTVDVIVPSKRRYYIETLYSHYEHTHDGSHLKLAGEVIKQKCPEYLTAFQRVLKRTSAHMFNTFIMKKELFHQYCEWLFPILSELEQQIDVRGMSAYEARFMGRISELLLDVWLEKNQIAYKEMPMVQLGKENWPKKIGSFLAAKYGNKKYGQSF